MEHAPSWLISSLIYLAAAVVAVPLSKALGLGSIIGYLVAGVVIGPWGLALVADPATILHFAEFGVVLMLFLVGLELEPSRLWAMRRPIFGWGSAQVVLCAAALVGAAVLFGIDWRVALAAALGLALSSTAIALQVMNERNTLRTTGGQSAFAILLFQDVAAIPILALVPLLGAGADDAAADASGMPVWLNIVRIVGVIALVVIGGRLAVRPALRWIARSRTPEVFTAASLLIVVAMAALMQWVGMSMALGAFLAGVLLAESEYKHELEADIAPFKGLLLGLFFMAVGMSIDFGALARAPLLLAVVLVAFLAVKAVALMVIARAMGMPFRDRPMFTLLLAQGGEFAFVVFQAAAGAKVFGADVASLLIGAVALSMLLTPLLVVAIDRWLMPRYASASKPEVEELSQPQTAPIVVAGFGRYGQMVSRLLMADGIGVTVLDHDAERIESARSFGYRVFYGDATRADLLVLAGAESARVIVVAVDDREAVNSIVDMARSRFAQAKLVVRVHDLSHAFDMLDRGVDGFEREVFEASLRSGVRVLDALGYAKADAQGMVDRFRAHNLELMGTAHRVRHDSAQLIAMTKRARFDLEQQMAQDQADRVALREHADATADAFGLPKAQQVR